MSDPNGLSYDQRGREPKIAYLADGAGDDVTLTLVKGGDHRLSTARDIALLTRTVSAFAEESDRSHRGALSGLRDK